MHISPPASRHLRPRRGNPTTRSAPRQGQRLAWGLAPALALVLAAAQAPARAAIAGDVDGNGVLDAGDLAAFAQAWRDFAAGRDDWNRRADLVGPDGRLDRLDAQQMLELWLARETALPAQLLAEAEEDLAAGRLAQAEDKLETVMQLRPAWVRPHGVLGVLEQVRGHEALAMGHYQDFCEGWRGLGLRTAAVALEVQFEARFLWLVNSERMNQGIAPLKPNAGIAAAALWHSDYMLAHDELTHDEDVPGYEKAWNRLEQFLGCMPRYVAENVGQAYGPGAVSLPMVDTLHQGFMDSSGHRRNILNEQGTDIGVAVAYSTRPTSVLFVTEDFAQMDPGGACPGTEPMGLPEPVRAESGPFLLHLPR